ncbi:Cubilin-like 12, partial [Homarus americanus]
MVTPALVLMVIAGVAADSFQVPAQARRLVTEDCGEINMVPGETKVIQDESNPSGNCSPNQRCQWTFNCGPEKSTYLKFRCPYFCLGDSTNCVKDRLILTSRGATERHCGTNSPDGTITSTGFARVTFRANRAVEDTGFRCYVCCFDKPTIVTKPPPTIVTKPPPTI